MKRKIVNIGLIIAMLIMILALLTGCEISNKSRLGKLEYDIVVEKGSTRTEGLNTSETPVGGYSTHYYYTLINSEKMEKYTISYEDIWQVHNDSGEKDNITINIEKINKDELQEYIDKYGKESKMKKVREMLDESIQEDYEIIFND